MLGRGCNTDKCGPSFLDGALSVVLQGSREAEQGVRRGFELAVGLVILVTGCDRKLLVGVVLPETGEAAVYGASIKSGVKLGFDSPPPGITLPNNLVVEYRDSDSDPTRAASAAEALYDAGSAIVIGGVTTAEAKAMIPVAERREGVLLSPSASAPELSGRSGYFFRVYPSDDLEGVDAADFLVLRRGVRTVFIVQEDNDYTRGLLPVFVAELRSRGGSVAGSVRTGDPSWAGQVRAAAVGAPDAFYLCGYGDAIVSALRVLRGASYRGIIATTSALNTAALLQRAGTLADGVLFPLAGFDFASREEPVRTFVSAYRGVYNLVPDIYAAHGYDAALATLAALSQVQGRSAAEVRRALRSLAGVRGVTGPLAFDDYGNVKQTLHVHTVHGGRVEDLEVPSRDGAAGQGGEPRAGRG